MLFKHRECQPTKPEMEQEAQAVSRSHTHVSHTLLRPWCARLYSSFVFMLPYVFRLHGFFVLSKLNTQAIIHDASEKPVQQQEDYSDVRGVAAGLLKCWQSTLSIPETNTAFQSFSLLPLK